MKFPEKGYLYIAIGENHIKEAVISAESLRKVDKKAHITLITDRRVRNQIFDHCIQKPFPKSKKMFIMKPQYIWESPYKKTFFIDSDTYFCENCRELFFILNYFDIAMMPAPIAGPDLKFFNNEKLKFNFYNTGIILFRKNLKNYFLFKKWKKIYERSDYSVDDPAIAHALFYSWSRIYPLSIVYNARIEFLISIPRDKVKILHGRLENYEKLGKFLNKRIENRSWNPVTFELSFLKSPFKENFKEFLKQKE